MEKRIVLRDVGKKSDARRTKNRILGTMKKLDKRAFFFLFHMDDEEKRSKGLKWKSTAGTLANEKRRLAS